MGLNKKGNLLWSVLIAIAFFMFAMLIINFLIDDVSLTRDTDHLNCAYPGTDGDKIVCLVVDIVIPAFILTVLGAIGTYLAKRIL